MSSTTKRAYNFAAGPSVLPESVLKACSEAILGLNEEGESILELSHRSSTFNKILEETKELLIELLGIPSTHKVLFFQGGGSGQFTATALNIFSTFTEDKVGDYLLTGTWSLAAYNQVKHLNLPVNVVYDARQEYNGKFQGLANIDKIKSTLNKDAAYLYYCDNETVNGVEIHDAIKDLGIKVPIICDMSSNIMAREIDFNRYAVIFAGAQKNLGPAGVTVVIVREDILNHNRTNLKFPIPSVLDYQLYYKNNSLFNTPPTFSILALKFNLNWVKNNGGLKHMIERAKKHSDNLFKAIDESSEFYCSPVKQVNHRSLTNIVFNLKNKELEEKFVNEAKQSNLINLKGHRSVGGIRVSLYNGLEDEAVPALIQFMGKFKNENS